MNNNAYKAPTVRLPTLEHLMGVNEDWGLELEQNEVSSRGGTFYFFYI
jgi:hypothetical protein